MTDALRDAWLNGRADRLGARGEAFAWALRKAWYAQGNGEYGLLKFVHENTSKPDGTQPHPDTLQLLFKRTPLPPPTYLIVISVSRPSISVCGGGRPQYISVSQYLASVYLGVRPLALIFPLSPITDGPIPPYLRISCSRKSG